MARTVPAPQKPGRAPSLRRRGGGEPIQHDTLPDPRGAAPPAPGGPKIARRSDAMTAARKPGAHPILFRSGRIGPQIPRGSLNPDRPTPPTPAAPCGPTQRCSPPRPPSAALALMPRCRPEGHPVPRHRNARAPVSLLHKYSPQHRSPQQAYGMCRRNHPDVTPHGRPQDSGPDTDTGTPMTICASSIKGTATPHAPPRAPGGPMMPQGRGPDFCALRPVASLDASPARPENSARRRGPRPVAHACLSGPAAGQANLRSFVR